MSVSQWMTATIGLLVGAMLQICLVDGKKDLGLYCGACKAIIDEVEYEISKVDPRKKIDVGSFRVDPNGKTKSVKVSFARSEGHIEDLLENICGGISNDYVKNVEKDSGEISLKRMVTRDGKMSSDVDFQALMERAQSSGDRPPDTDSKDIRFICESIIEEHEDEFVKYISNNDKDVVYKICSEAGEYCTEEEDDGDHDDKSAKVEL